MKGSLVNGHWERVRGRAPGMSLWSDNEPDEPVLAYHVEVASGDALSADGSSAATIATLGGTLYGRRRLSSSQHLLAVWREEAGYEGGETEASHVLRC